MIGETTWLELKGIVLDEKKKPISKGTPCVVLFDIFKMTKL